MHPQHPHPNSPHAAEERTATAPSHDAPVAGSPPAVAAPVAPVVAAPVVARRPLPTSSLSVWLLSLLLVASGALFLVGCGGSSNDNGSGGSSDPTRRVVFDIAWPALALPPSRQTIPAPSVAQSVEVRIEGTGGFVPVTDILNRNPTRTEAHTETFRSPLLNLNALGGPLSFRDGATFTLRLRAYTQEQAQGALVSEIRIENAKLRVGGGGNDDGVLEDGGRLVSGFTPLSSTFHPVIEAGQQFPAGILKRLRITDSATGFLPLGAVLIEPTDGLEVADGLRGYVRATGERLGNEIPVRASVFNGDRQRVGNPIDGTIALLPRVAVTLADANANPLAAGAERSFFATVANRGDESDVVLWRVAYQVAPDVPLTLEQDGVGINAVGLLTTRSTVRRRINNVDVDVAVGGDVVVTATSRLEELEFPEFATAENPALRFVNRGQTTTARVEFRIVNPEISLTVVVPPGGVALGDKPFDVPAASSASRPARTVRATTPNGAPVRWEIEETDGGRLEEVRDGATMEVLPNQITYRPPARPGLYTVRATTTTLPTRVSRVFFNVLARDVPVILK